MTYEGILDNNAQLLRSTKINPGTPPNNLPSLTGSWPVSAIQNLADNASASSLSDVSGNGNTMTNAAISTTAPVYVKSAWNNKPALKFNGTTMGLGNTSTTINKAAFTMFCVCEPDVTDGINMLMSGTSTLFGQFIYQGIQQFNNGGLIGSSPGTNTPPLPGPILFMVIYDGTTLTMRVNGGTSFTSSQSTSGTVTSVALGYQTNPYYGSGQFYDWGLYSTNLSSAQYQALEKWLMAEYNIVPWPNINNPLVVFDGNSLMSGLHITDSYSCFPAQTMRYLPSSIQWRNYAYPGAASSALTTRATTLIDPLYDARRQGNILVYLEGYNDQSYAHYSTYLAARVSAGWTIVALTIPSYVSESTRLTTNASIRSNYQANSACVIADVGGDPYMGLVGNSGDTTWFFSDGIHLSAAGSARIAKFHLAGAIAQALGISPPAGINRFAAGTVDNTAWTLKYLQLNTAHEYLSGSGATVGTQFGLTLRATAQRVDVGGTESGYFERRYLVQVSSGGTVTLNAVGTDIVYYSTGGFTTAGIAAVASGQGLLLQVTGETGKTVAWALEYDLVGTA